MSKEEKPTQAPWISAQSAIGGAVSFVFALVAMAALYFYFSTPVIPPTVESYPTVAFREIGGNSGQLFGLCLLAIGAGVCSIIGLCAVITDRSYDYRR